MNEERTDYFLQQCQNEVERNLAGRYPDFPALPPIPAARYFDPEYYALENLHFWPRTWCYAGFANELPEVGSFKLRERGGVSIVLVRGHDLKIRAFYNTCQHRGGALVKQDSGKVRNLVCKFHGWVYDIEGHLKGVPFKQDFSELEFLEDDIALKPLRCETWGNMIFVNQYPSAPPLVDFLGPLTRDFEDAGLDRRNAYKTVMRSVRCNWKVMMDAFAEGYHIPVTHPETINPFSDVSGSYIQMYRNGHGALYIPTVTPQAGAQTSASPTSGFAAMGSPEHRITRETILNYSIFPNISVTKAEFQYAYLMFWPTSVNTTDIEVVFTAPEGLDDPDDEINKASAAAYDVILEEDIDNLSWLQKSIESGALNNVRIGYSERRVYQIAEEIDRRIGIERIPAPLRVQQILDRYCKDPYEIVTA